MFTMLKINKTKKKTPPFWSLANFKEMTGLLLLVFLIRTFGFGLYQVPSGSMETTMLVGERFFADKFSYLFTEPKHGDIISANQPNFVYSENPIKRLYQHYVWGPENWTKRIIGVPGDLIEGKIEGDRPVIYRNGIKLDEPYLNAFPILAMWKVDPSGLMQHMAGRSQDEVWKKITMYSYDPARAYNDQPFYSMDPQKIVLDPNGNPLLQWPGTPIFLKLGENETTSERRWDRSDVFRVRLTDDEYWCMGDNRLGSSDSRYFGPFKRGSIHGRIRFCIWSHDSDASWFVLELIKNPIKFFKQIRWDRCLKFVR